MSKWLSSLFGQSSPPSAEVSPARTAAQAVAGSGTRRYFLSHDSGDDDVVRWLRAALADLDVHLSVDSRDFAGGDPLSSAIRGHIERSSGFLVLVSPRAHGSTWVGREIRHALTVQKERGGHDTFPVVPLLLDGTPLGAFGELFDETPIPVAVQSTALDDALHPILVALRLRSAADPAFPARAAVEPVEELLLQLTDPSVVTRADGSRRARARAQLVHVPAMPGQRQVESPRFVLEAPLGVIEASELQWYLDDFAVWPSPLLGQRAQRIEAQLADWGRMLHEAALPAGPVAEVLKSWGAAGSRAARRFSIEVDSTPDASMSEEEVLERREAGTWLLGLPWELLHDGRRFLFQGEQPVRVRRRLPTKHAVPVAALSTPIRVLLVSPRPEDEVCAYIDHRASAHPLVEAIEALAGQVELHLLAPPTLPALRGELERSRAEGRPYHVLHFDGHGVYDRTVGMGALCFEHEEDGQLARGPRRHAVVPTSDLGALLRDHGIPLVFLEACQSAQAEGANESVAGALLKTGVGSVVAMSHSVLVGTARRFVESFYAALAEGARIGGAMLAGQRALKDSPVRGRLLGSGEFTLADWFVPVLYQDREDPQLFHRTPAPLTLEVYRERLQNRLGELPPVPAQGFVGRSRELLELERLLAVERYAVLRGQGGEGKTALAAEFVRWRVLSRQVQRVAFVSMESHGHVQAVLDALGRQLVGKDYSVAIHPSLEAAIEPVLRELREQTTLLVIDNLESVLAAPFAAEAGHADRDDTLTADDRERAEAILMLAARLMAAGETRVVFTSREALPAPFDGETQRIELHRLSRQDAVQLIERTLEDTEGPGRAANALRAEIESLVEAVHGHARTLSLLAPALKAQGPAATQADLVSLMAEMERRFPGQREHSLLASVELSLRRLPPDLRERAQVLGVFHGAVYPAMLKVMTGWETAEVVALSKALVTVGLATPERYNHLTLNPALCPYLAAGGDPDERKALLTRWTGAMRAYAEFLWREQDEDIEMAATLTLMDLADLMALLDAVEDAGDAEATIGLTTTLHALLRHLNRPRLMTRIAQARDAATQTLGEERWGHAQFIAESTRIGELRQSGRVGESLTAAQRLHARAMAVSDSAYDGAGYDQAMACFQVGRALWMAGQADAALPQYEEAQRRFEASEARDPGRGAARMAAVALTGRADCLLDLGRLDEAAQAYEQAMALDEARRDDRALAVGKGQLGTVRLMQGRFPEALAAHCEARERFKALGEPHMVATAWHQIGMVHQDAGNGEAAEDAYRQSLALSVQLENVAGQASTLNELGLLCDSLGRPEDAVTHYRQAAERYVALQDVSREGTVRGNLALTLRRLGRLAEARTEIERVLVCKQGLGQAAKPWKTWDILADIENDSGRATEAHRAWTQARDAYLAYRRAGGESSSPCAHLAADIGQLLLTGDTAAASDELQRLAGTPAPPAWFALFVEGLQALAEGARNPSIADARSLDYGDAAELLLLLESLSAAGR